MKTDIALYQEPTEKQPGLITASLKKPAIMELAETNQARFFIQFAGQAGLYIDEVRSLYETYPSLRPFIETAAEAIQRELIHPEAIGSGRYTWGFDTLSWIKNKTSPPLAYISSSVISQTLTFLTQVCHYKSVVEYGNAKTILRYTLGLTGHSQGIMPAVLLSLNLEGEEFEKIFLQMLRLLFWQGLRMQESYMAQDVPAALKEECALAEWGTPAPMAAVIGLSEKQLQPLLDKVNAKLEAHEKISLTLVNGFKRLILSGSATALILLRRKLQGLEKGRGEEGRVEFLNVSAPFHSPQMLAGYERFIERDLARIGLHIQGKDLKLPVYATNDGRNLQESKDLIGDLLKMQYLQPVDWNACTRKATQDHGVTHILDFGPGDMAGTLTFLNREGEGIAVIPCATPAGRDLFLTTDPKKVPFVKGQWKDLAPRVVKIGNTRKLENNYTRFTGNGPVFGGGMTPTSVETDIVASALNEGYLVEWAGGGQATEAILRHRLKELTEKLKVGKWITFNALYLDPYLWNLHFPLVPQLKSEGFPIEGFTISAGIPSRDKAKEICAQMSAHGIWCLSFKPGSDSQIKSVLEIAQDHPTMTLIMQIEGGKAGGHHSWEDLYGLLERNYARVRRQKNIILCVGGGIGFEEEAYRFISGQWHESGKLMPVDGVILGTRLMACKEAKTTPQVKNLLASIEGTKAWVGRHEFKGGVTSGQSQLGADVHYADNLMARVADQVDQISALEEGEILKRKDEIVKLLDQTAKPYFGDVERMTYSQVLERMLELMAPGNMPKHFIADGPFFDITFRKMVFKFAERIVARLGDEASTIAMEDLDNPKEFLKNFSALIPQAKEKLLHPEDMDYFFLICREPGKPVNFVPIIDKNIKRWFKSDSLWQAHDPRYLPEQVLTIPGPEAVKGIKRVDEPVAEVLAGFEKYIVDKILQETKTTESDVVKIPFLGFDADADTFEVEHSVENRQSDNAKESSILVIKNIVDTALWGMYLAKQGKGPIAALFASPRLLDGKAHRENFIPKILSPRQGARVHILRNKEKITSVSYFSADKTSAPEAPAAVIQLPADKNEAEILLYLYHKTATGKELRLDVKLHYHPENTHAPLSVDAQNLHTNVRALYQNLWSTGKAISQGSPWKTFREKVTIDQKTLQKFSVITHDTTSKTANREASPSFAIALFWGPLAQCLLHEGLNINLLDLLHLANEFTWDDSLRAGETYMAEVKLISVGNDAKGKTLKVEGKLLAGKKLVARMKSSFLVRGAFAATLPVSETQNKTESQITVTELVQHLLPQKNWLILEKDIQQGDVLKFVLQHNEKRHAQATDYKTLGEVYSQGKKIGRIHFEEKNSRLLKDPVLFFTKEYGDNGKAHVKQEGGLSFTETVNSPLSNVPYALVSQDLNPIHTDEKFALLAGLPHGTIVHGMWTSAAALAAVARRYPKILSWQTEYTSMVLANTRLTIKAEHSANQDGHKLFAVMAEDEKGTVVLKGRAKVAQKKTAYVFTGQGSQVAGMGMAAYQKSEAARAIWDRVERFCQDELGFSIIAVVRDNPKEMLVDGQRVFHPKGVLHLTQFTQVGLTVLAMAQVAELKAAGLYQNEAMFAGHSLGEYASLSCFDILRMEDVVRLVYHRGLTMQHFVPRDEAGRSLFGMVVVRPNVIAWSERNLEERVRAISQASHGEAIHVVNYNIEGSQYSVTGHVKLLKKLEQEMLKKGQELKATKPACVWIEGVDVPFHSPLLKEGVAAFRKKLQETITEFHPEFLVARYVPNLNGEPFRLEKDYVLSVQAMTGSPILKDVLGNWSQNEKDPSSLSRILLIELLAYQFASPVRWIQTQKIFLTHPSYQVERVIEIGPSPVLANMLRATLKREAPALYPEIHHFDTERDAVFYQHEEKAAALAETPAPSSEAKQKDIAAVAEKSASVTPTARATLAAPADRPFTPERGLKTLLALKFKIRLDEIKDADTLESLSGGNSAKRNELLSDIGEEFDVDALEEAHLMPIGKLATLLAEKTHYTKPGPFIQKAIDRMIVDFLCLSKNEISFHCRQELCLPESLLHAALCHVTLAARSGDSNKSGKLSELGLEARISDKQQSLTWLESAVDDFGAAGGIHIPHASQASVTGGSVVSEAALNELQEKFFGKDGPFAHWAQELSELCRWSENKSEDRERATLQEEVNQLKLYQAAFGPNVEKVIRPIFDADKIVTFTSSWNWGRERLSRRFWELVSTKETFAKTELSLLKNQITHEALALAKFLAGIARDKGNLALAGDLQDLSEISTEKKPHFTPTVMPLIPTVSVSEAGEIIYQEKTRAQEGKDFAHFVKEILHKKHIRADGTWAQVLTQISQEGLSFAGKVALVTGASPGSIAWETLKSYLAGGATVVATTSSYSESRLKAYRELYQEFAARGATLYVVPFSQGSYADIQNLVAFCVARGLLIDFVLPFGAVGEVATLTMMQPDASTATLRVLLQGVEWLMGAIARKHKEVFAKNHRCLVILPLSPNHGVFGGDGAYADAKLGLESLLNKWKSEYEDWGRYVSLIGATIGWVRGTALMEANNLIAAAMEKDGRVRTFSTAEMGTLLVALCHDKMREQAQKSPLSVSLTGGFEKIKNLAELARNARATLEKEAGLKRLLNRANALERQEVHGLASSPAPRATRKAKIESEFPDLTSYDELLRARKTPQLDPADIIVVVGFGEVSPFGSSKPRWDMECGEISQTGAIELAWLMGLIRYDDGMGKSKYQAWVDAKSLKPLADTEIWATYGKFICANTGIRFADPQVQRFDPKNSIVFGSVALDVALTFTVEGKIQALEYAQQYQNAAIKEEGGLWSVTLPKGSLIKVPRRVALKRWVAGQIPLGWDATRLGIPKDLVTQVDRNTLFNMIASAEAFLRAGLSPAELPSHFAPSLIGNSQGGGMGGMTSLDRMYHDHREDRERQGDTLQETLINVGPAWVAQSLVGSYGPMVHPVGACATALVSLGVAADLIGMGKADFVVAGGFDDYSEEGVIGFQDMQATCDTEEMLKQGILPAGMSRPNDVRRGGFVESQGGGTLLLTRLNKAIDLGLPVYAVVGFTGSYGDGVHTSIPAPGLGLLGMARGGENSPLGCALKRFGLTADDITVVSKHDTSTAVNDPNENKLHQLIQESLGRTRGNPLYVHSQKSLLGHAKGGAGAWQAIAALQMLERGKVPGNRNLEDVDAKMRAYDFLSFSDKTLKLGKKNIHAVLMTSLGFGHIGAATLFIHPDYVLSLLSKSAYEKYGQRRQERECAYQRKYYRMLLEKEPLFERRAERPGEGEEIEMLLRGH